MEFQRTKLNIWPVWTEAQLKVDIEKFDSGGKGGGTRDRGSLSNALSEGMFDDPENYIVLPRNLNAEIWKRPTEFICEKTPVVVETDRNVDFAIDLVTRNGHLMCNDIMAHIINEIMILWKFNQDTFQPTTSLNHYFWKPWEHIFAPIKGSKGLSSAFNPGGKYFVRLFWMGNWRRVTVDDRCPFDEDEQMLLPVSHISYEIWSMVLAKAILKAHNLSGHVEKDGQVFPSVMYYLTGWLPEIWPIKEPFIDELWELMKSSILEWTLPLEEPGQEAEKEICLSPKGEKGDNTIDHKADHKVSLKVEHKIDHKLDQPTHSRIGKKGRRDTIKEKDKAVLESRTVLNNLKLIFIGKQKFNSRISKSDINADAESEETPETYLVTVTKTRSCPLVHPLPEPIIPAWKKIRQRMEESVYTKPVKEHRFLWIASSSSLQHFVPEDDWYLSICSCESFFTPAKSLLVPSNQSKSRASMARSHASLTKEELPILWHEIWIEFKDFLSQFHYVYIYHKPSCYAHSAFVTDMKPYAYGNAKQWLPVYETDNPAVNDLLLENPSLQECFSTDASKLPEYLYVDSITPSEILVSMSVLSNWPVHFERTVRGSVGKEVKHGTKESDSQERAAIPLESDCTKCWHPGYMMLIQHSWVNHEPAPLFFSMEAFSHKTVKVQFPAGRHVYKIHCGAPILLHINFFSNANFAVGDEDTILPKLLVESLLFEHHAKVIYDALYQGLSAFSGDHEQFLKARMRLCQSYTPCLDDKTVKIKDKNLYTEAFRKALYLMLSGVLSTNQITIDMELSLRSLLVDWESPSVFPHLHTGEFKKRRSTPRDSVDGYSRDGSIPTSPCRNPTKSDAQVTEVEEQFKNNFIDNNEAVSSVDCDHPAVKIQSCWRGYIVRKMKQCYIVGTAVNHMVSIHLETLLRAIDNYRKDFPKLLLQNYVKHLSPSLVERCPYSPGRDQKLVYQDYKGTINQPIGGTWFVMFHHVFFPTCESVLVAKLLYPLPNVWLHVTDNDSGILITNQHKSVVLANFKVNKLGYSVIVEAFTPEPITGKQFKLRLISPTALPQCKPEAMCSNCIHKELNEYFAPNNDSVLMKYKISPLKQNIPATLRLVTSYPRARISLTVFDKGVAIRRCEGIGKLVIPSVLFFRSLAQEPVVVTTPRKRNVATPGSKKATPASETKKAVCWDLFDKEPEEHEYIILATVVNDSWPLNQDDLLFIQTLHDMEAENSKAYKPPVPTENKKTGKKVKSRRVSVADFDKSKPHSTLQVFIDESLIEDFSIKKDTSRNDEIKAIKRAWEDADPGRAERAREIRCKFLEKNSVKVEVIADDTSSNISGDDNAARAIISPKSLVQESATRLNELLAETALIPFDDAPYVKCTRSQSVLKDDALRNEDMETKKLLFKKYSLKCDEVNAWRAEERKQRNSSKWAQMNLCQNLRLNMAEARNRCNIIRESIRAKQAKETAERFKVLKEQEEEAIQVAAAQRDKERKEKRKKSPRSKKSKK